MHARFRWGQGRRALAGTLEMIELPRNGALTYSARLVSAGGENRDLGGQQGGKLGGL